MIDNLLSILHWSDEDLTPSNSSYVPSSNQSEHDNQNTTEYLLYAENNNASTSLCDELDPAFQHLATERRGIDAFEIALNCTTPALVDTNSTQDADLLKYAAAFCVIGFALVLCVFLAHKIQLTIHYARRCRELTDCRDQQRALHAAPPKYKDHKRYPIVQRSAQTLAESVDSSYSVSCSKVDTPPPCYASIFHLPLSHTTGEFRLCLDGVTSGVSHEPLYNWMGATTSGVSSQPQYPVLTQTSTENSNSSKVLSPEIQWKIARRRTEF